MQFLIFFLLPGGCYTSAHHSIVPLRVFGLFAPKTASLRIFSVVSWFCKSPPKIILLLATPSKNSPRVYSRGGAVVKPKTFSKIMSDKIPKDFEGQGKFFFWVGGRYTHRSLHFLFYITLYSFSCVAVHPDFVQKPIHTRSSSRDVRDTAAARRRTRTGSGTSRGTPWRSRTPRRCRSASPPRAARCRWGGGEGVESPGAS